MSVADTAVAWAKTIAADDSHGYDQGSRWGPDYDCSSLVISAYKKAGVPLTCTYTGNMRADMLTHGFKDVTKNITLSTGKGLKKGDVLLHEAKHTALYIGSGKVLHAAGNEYGKAVGGKTGDQTGKEIGVTGYFNFPWECVLRYDTSSGADAPPSAPLSVGSADISPRRGESSPQGEGFYTVKRGDSLWGIAEKELGNGLRYEELRRLNGLDGYMIHPGQVLKLPGKGGEAAGGASPAPADTPESVSVALPVLRKGGAGAAVKALQTLLLNAGIDVGSSGVDGDFGEDTWVAVCDLQRRMNTAPTGEVKAAEWKALITEGSK